MPRSGFRVMSFVLIYRFFVFPARDACPLANPLHTTF
jgi:hypothetical protein